MGRIQIAEQARVSALQVLKSGKNAILQHVTDPALASRLLSMGIIPGVKLRLIRHTLGGHTYIILAGNHYFAMRKGEIEALGVQPAEV